MAREIGGNADKASIHVFTIEKTITVSHFPEQKTLVGDWESLCTGQFREALQRAAAEARLLGTKSWIADLTRDPGVPAQEDLRWVETFDVGNALSKGVTACTTCSPKTRSRRSPRSRISTRRHARSSRARTSAAASTTSQFFSWNRESVRPLDHAEPVEVAVGAVEIHAVADDPAHADFEAHVVELDG